MGTNFMLLVALIAIFILKGDGKDSVIDVKRCSDIDWTLFAILQVVCIIFLAIGIIIVQKEY